MPDFVFIQYYPWWDSVFLVLVLDTSLASYADETEQEE